MIREHCAGCEVLAPRCDGAHVDAVGTQGIHADPVAEQCAASTPARRIDRQHRDAHLRVTTEEAIQYFVGNAALAGTTGPRNADHGDGACFDLPGFA